MRLLRVLLAVFAAGLLAPAWAQAPAGDVNALTAAVSREDVDAVTKMLAADPGLLDAAAKANQPVLYDAIASRRDTTEDNRRAMVSLLLAKGADPNRSGRNLIYTPLIEAEQKDSAPLAALLLDKGADPNVADLQGVSPLAHALEDGRKDFALLLVGRGLKLDVRDKSGFTPLHVVARSAGADAALVQAMLDKGADVNARAGSPTDPYNHFNWPLRALDQRGLTPLHVAAASGSPDVVRLLLARGASLKARTDDGNTPLHEAAHTLSPSVAILLAAGADPNAKNRAGDLPLHLALKSGTQAGPEAALALIAASDLSAPGQSGLTPLGLAIVGHRAEALAALRAHGPKPPPALAVFDAAARNDVPALTALLAARPSLAVARLPNGWTPIHAAALWAALDAAKLLLARGADVNAAGIAAAPPLDLALSRLGEPGAARAVVLLLIRAGANVNRGSGTPLSPLQLAVSVGDDALVTLLLARHADVNARNLHGDFPLLFALNNPALMTKLLAAGANVNAQDSVQMTALTRSLTSGGANPDVARLLIEHGADVNGRDRAGFTPLMRAVMTGSAALVTLMLDKGADVQAGNDFGRTALKLAVRQSPDLVALLRQHGATDASPPPARPSNDVISVFNMAASGDSEGVKAALDKDPALLRVRDDNGDTLLHKAFWNNYGAGHHLMDMVTLLVTRGADVKARSRDDQTPLYTAASCVSPEIGTAAALLLAKGADPNARDRHAQTPLHRAATPDFVALLVHAGANVNVRDDNGNTPLHLAASYQHAVVPALLAAGADANARNGDGEIPLHLAYQRPGIVLTPLLEAHSDILLRDQYGMAPIMRLFGRDFPRAVAAHNVKPDDTLRAFQAAAIGDVPTLSRLLAAKPFLVSARLPNGQTPLHLAALGRAQGTALLLLAKGADVNARDGLSVTPLLAAVRLLDDKPNVRAIASLLLEHGADPNAVSGQGNAPIHQAFWADDPLLFPLLLARHADPSLRDGQGDTPLHLAVSRPKDQALQIAATLLAAGADVNAWGRQDPNPGGYNGGSDGPTPLEAAIASGSDDLARFLIEKGADVNAPGATGETPLSLANRLHRTDLAATLSAHGARDGKLPSGILP